MMSIFQKMHRDRRRISTVIKTRISKQKQYCKAMQTLGGERSQTTKFYSSFAGVPKSRQAETEDDLVISGVSGRFPYSDSIEEFKENLYNKVDMVREQTRFKCQSIPSRYGFLKSLDKFDAEFFGIAPRMAHYMDPQQRILLEVGFEAILDSGINPEVLKGTATGVFVGAIGTEAFDYWLLGPSTGAMEGYGASIQGLCLANRLSFSLDLRGPSLVVNTGCSASFVALEAAVQSIRSGVCDAALVAGTAIHVSPFTSVDYSALGALAPDGKCKTFDAASDGFARSEAVAAILVQKKQDAKRAYATVRNIESNADGYKHSGFTYPSGASQERLLKNMYTKAGIDPGKIMYVEAHGTGTPAGDQEELPAISNVFCKTDSRQRPLLVGSVKTNMGHGESAAGICSVAKMLISFQEGKLPPNLHFNQFREKNLINSSSIQVVTKTTRWTGGLVGINSFGVGGTNAHLILEAEKKQESLPSKPHELPVILPFSGRTEEGVRESLHKAGQNVEDPQFVGLVHNVFKSNICGHYVRGHLISPSGQELPIHVDTLPFEGGQRPVVFIFTGMGSQWSGMGKEMQRLDRFRSSLVLSRETLRNKEMDLDKLLWPSNSTIFTNIRDAIVSITAIQLALYDTMTSIGVTPDIFIGHSFGEILCGYADGSFTAAEALLVAEARGRAFQEANLMQFSTVPGAMANIGLSWEEVASICPPDIYLACNNSKSNVTISGSTPAVMNFVERMKNEGIFSGLINSCGYAAHSPYVSTAGKFLKDYILEFYPKEKQLPRSDRWISTSFSSAIFQDELKNPTVKYNSALYHANNMTSPVLFHEAVKSIPKNAAVVEIAPAGLLQGILKKSLGRDNFLISPMTSARNSEKINHFLDSLGKLYNAGVNVDMSVLYPPIYFPVSVSTPTLSSLIKWNHEETWTVPIVPNFTSKATEGITFKVDLGSEEWSFLEGHKLDKRIIFPATGSLYLVWQGLTSNLGIQLKNAAVCFEDVRFERPVFLDADKPTEFKLALSNATGFFELKEGETVVAVGNIQQIKNFESNFEREISENFGCLQKTCKLQKEDIYKELRLRGYNFSGKFQGVQQADIHGTWAKVSWTGNWISFLDTVLHTTILSYQTNRYTAVPVRLQKAAINPKELQAFLNNHANIRLTNVENGVEICNLTTKVIPRKQQLNALCLEEYKFTPYFDDVKKSLDVGITYVIDLVLENLGSKKIKFFDVFHKSENSVAEFVQKAMRSRPSRQAEIKTALIQTKIEKLNRIPKMDDVKIKEDFSIDLTANLVFFDNFAAFSEKLQDLQRNQYLVVHSRKKFGAAIETGDFLKIAQVALNDSALHVFKKRFVPESKKFKVVRIDQNNFEWLPQLQYFMAEETSEREPCSRIYLTSQNDPTSGIIGLVNCLRQEDGGEKIRCIFDPQSLLSLNFEKPNHTLMEILTKDLVINVVNDGQLGSYRHISLKAQSLISWKMMEHAYVDHFTSGDLSSFRWTESPLKYSNKDKTLCKVNYASMNFRDVMMASGLLSMDASTVCSDNGLGFEFSGVDPDGNRIMGIVTSKALATSVLANPDLYWKIPDSWTLEEAATVPVAYATAYYAMFFRGQLRHSQSILIHSATGGVGQAAIRLALNSNCEVFTTVGNEDKRKFVKILFPSLKNENIFSSRDCNFEKKVLKRTGGKGVNFVLNSLSSEKLQASIRCLAKYGKFLEIASFDAEQNTGLGMSCFLKNMDFQSIYLNQVFEEQEEHRTFIKNAIETGMSSGEIKPLTRTVFETSTIQEAFRFMASGKHVGKVLIKVQEEKKQANLINETPFKIRAASQTYFNPEKSYIIVGGLGGLGLEVAGWMVGRGAKTLILTSRSGITTGYQQLCLNNWEAQGVNVQTSTVDLSHYEKALDFFQSLLQIQSIGGIFNSGMVLKDASIENQTTEMFEAVAVPKALMTQNMDKISRELFPDLDYFVVFSSVVCGRGNRGQSNYAFSNSVMERICEERRKDKLHGLAIQWWEIGEVGYSTQIFGLNSEILGRSAGIIPRPEILEGTVPQTIQSCLEVLDRAMNKNCAIISSVVFANMASGQAKTGGILATFSNAFAVRNLSKIRPETKLVDLGMDSLISMEIRQTLQRDYDICLTPKEIRSLTFGDLLAVNAGTFRKESSATAKSLTVGRNHSLGFSTWPEETIVSLSHSSDWNKSPRLFFIHGIEGHARPFQVLAGQLNVNSYGLQYSENVSTTCIQEIAAQYIKEIKKVDPDGPYSICGYSSGATIAFEIASILEQDFGNQVSNLIILDGCLSWDQVKIKEISLFTQWMAQFSNNASQRFIDKLSAAQSSEECRTTILDFLKFALPNANHGDITKHMNRIMDYFYLTMNHVHRRSYKFGGNATLIKAVERKNFLSEIKNMSYNLNEHCSGPIFVYTVQGNHQTFLDSFTVEETSRILNSILGFS